MICSILLLITLTSCVSGPLVVDVTQSSYQAEENHNVTLEWTFKTRTDGSLKSMRIFCEMFTDLTSFILFHLHEGVEVSESQHERFAGRVQFEKDVLREGRLRLHMSRLRTDDSGLYLCDVFTGHDEGSRKCYLNVTGPLVVDVTQSSYQAEENHDVTLEWTFKTTTDGSFKFLNIFCEMFTDLTSFILFELDKGVEVSESQHERFAGRVQFDKDVLREGRLRLHMSRLRTNDSGLYQCAVATGIGEGSRECHLNVTAERVRPKPETPNSSSGGRDASTTGSPSQPERRGRIGFYWVLGLIVVAGTLLGVYYCLCRNQHDSMNPSPSIELDPMIHSPPKELDPMNPSPPK
ncbi:hypothetical protein VZT92_017397 [Zoarces viviparus]|uniref:Uncharacterized protein n=1 Tax=Zoarces viviparus TaxID=48416 RepID=A0AAW1ES63_ZOAVI